jgi:hypothetical protein
MLEKAVNLLGAFVTFLAGVGYDAAKQRLAEDARATPPADGRGSARAPAARLRKQARLPGWRNAVLRLVAGILRVFILFGVPALVVLALSLVLVDR